jgi:hypothetical protein
MVRELVLGSSVHKPPQMDQTILKVSRRHMFHQEFVLHSESYHQMLLKANVQSLTKARKPLSLVVT